MFFYKQVYNGISKNEESLIELEGSIPDDRTAISTTNKMLVYFHSDYGTSESGFTAHYMAQSSGTLIQGGVEYTLLVIKRTILTHNCIPKVGNIQTSTEDIFKFSLLNAYKRLTIFCMLNHTSSLKGFLAVSHFIHMKTLGSCR